MASNQSTSNESPAARRSRLFDEDGACHIPVINFIVYSLAICASTGGFLYGYNIGNITADTKWIVKELKLDNDQLKVATLLMSELLIAALFALLSGCLTDCFGRKPCIMFAALVYSVAAALLSATKSYTMLFIGRSMAGIAEGIVVTAVPIYVSECAPPQNRGRLLVLYQLHVSLGILTAILLSAVLVNTENNWRITLGLGAVPGLLQFVFFINAPESPRYLVMKGKLNKAADNLRYIRNKKYIWRELNAIIFSMESHEKTSGWMKIKAMFTGHTRKAFFLICMLQIFQQGSGHIIVTYFIPHLMMVNGMKHPLNLYVSVMPPALDVIVTTICLWAVEKCGRRKLLVTSHLGMCISLGVLLCSFLPVYMRTLTIDPDNEAGYYVTSNCLNHTECKACTEQAWCGLCAEMDPIALPMKGSCVSYISIMDTEFAEEGRCSMVVDDDNDNDEDDKHGNAALQHIVHHASQWNLRHLSMYTLLAVSDDKKEKHLNTSLKVTPEAVSQVSFKQRIKHVNTKAPQYKGGGSMRFFQRFCPEMHPWISLVAFTMFLSAHASGSGTVLWLLTSEFCPLWLRSTFVSVASCIYFNSYLVYLYALYTVDYKISAVGLFLSFFPINVAAVFFVVLLVPETAGMELEEIEWLFMSHEQRSSLMQCKRHLMVEKKRSLMMLRKQGKRASRDILTKFPSFTSRNSLINIKEINSDSVERFFNVMMDLRNSSFGQDKSIETTV